MDKHSINNYCFITIYIGINIVVGFGLLSVFLFFRGDRHNGLSVQISLFETKCSSLSTKWISKLHPHIAEQLVMMR